MPFRDDLHVLKQIPLQDVARRLGFAIKRNGRCPFPGHADATPSFSFFPSTNSCWCHGCSRGGDVIAFVATTQKWTAGEAIRWLREVYGSDAPQRRTAATSIGRRVAQTNASDGLNGEPQFAANPHVYAALLDASPMTALGSAYLMARGLNERTIEHFKLGFISDSQLSCRDLVSRFGLAVVRRSGLLNPKGQSFGLVFPSSSILFPFYSNGQVAYVQTRSLQDTTGRRWMGPTGVSRMIFNREAVLKPGPIYICEGAMDVISAHQLKLSAIGLLGASSGIPEDLLPALRTRSVYIVPDDDEAGEAMARNLSTRLKRAGIQSTVKRLTLGKDINEFLSKSRRQT